MNFLLRYKFLSLLNIVTSVVVFRQVNPKWYMDFYWQLKAKLQIQRQTRLLIFDPPDGAMGVPAPVYEAPWKFITLYTDSIIMISNTFADYGQEKYWST